MNDRGTVPGLLSTHKYQIHSQSGASCSGFLVGFRSGLLTYYVQVASVAAQIQSGGGSACPRTPQRSRPGEGVPQSLATPI